MLPNRPQRALVVARGEGELAARTRHDGKAGKVPALEHDGRGHAIDLCPGNLDVVSLVGVRDVLYATRAHRKLAIGADAQKGRGLAPKLDLPVERRIVHLCGCMRAQGHGSSLDVPTPRERV